MNAIADNLRLYDLSTRHQIYIEGIKAGIENEFNVDLKTLAQDFNALFARTRFENVGAMTRAQLNFLLVQLRRLQATFYSDFSKKLIERLQEYMNADLQISRQIYSAAFNPPTMLDNGTVSEDDANDFFAIWAEQRKVGGLFGIAAITTAPALLWAKIENAPIPANGVTLPSFIKAFTLSASGGAENLVRQAWANKWSMGQLLIALMNGSKQGQSSHLDRVLTQGKAVLSTVLQHVKSFVAAGVQSVLFPKYIWVSVIDRATTDVCRSRNLTVYLYGQGPIPPAHVRCRSHITPFGVGADIPNETLSRWLARQPETVQKDIATRVDETGKYSPPPLTIAQFKRKLRLIMAS